MNKARIIHGVEKFSDTQQLGSICKTGLGFPLMYVTLLIMLKCTFDCFPF